MSLQKHWEYSIIHVCASDQTWPWKHDLRATLPLLMADNGLTQDGEVPRGFNETVLGVYLEVSTGQRCWCPLATQPDSL